MWTSGVYRVMLRCYPYDYRARFAMEMVSAFERSVEERRAQGGRGLAHFALREFAHLARGAAAEWMAKWTTDPVTRGRYLPDVRMMRPAGMPRETWFAAYGPERDGCS